MASENLHPGAALRNRAGDALNPLVEQVLLFDRQVRTLKDSQDLLQSSIRDVMREMEDLENMMPPHQVAERIAHLAMLRERAFKVADVLTMVESRLQRVQAHLLNSTEVNNQDMP
eukprot:jgi/Botrbrau1/16672/Bobra.0068s0088.1